MFDVAFSELVVIALIALLVVGPEKLPKLARTLGILAGRLQRYVSTVKADIEREMQIEELHKLQREVQQQARHIQADLNLESAQDVDQDKKPQLPQQ